MKNLGVFYLIFVVLLSVLPCSDELEGQEFTQQIIVKIDHDKAKGSAESCSPICLCSCCGQSVIEPQFIAFQSENGAFIVENQTSTHDFSLEQRAKNIWQPPKLS
ncbi:DUF6660 family protein [Pedobacter boryungensis]|uniref:DUF2946 domain-containing protein n=1 Tax=Pedobacter boryungensis TaxID=869962 RepID=A0ABX2DDI6_9SPHI|nr:DUF6660 family protein [Pedobacter boryungensis]NQX32135.1 hypothetical protein [Pedobacter boryungensis]